MLLMYAQELHIHGFNTCFCWKRQDRLPTLTKGARQLVVHEALEMMGYSCLYWSALTPTTKVGMSEPLAGAVIRTFLAPACVQTRGESMHICRKEDKAWDAVAVAVGSSQIMFMNMQG
jgi:hypothetical protein